MIDFTIFLLTGLPECSISCGCLFLLDNIFIVCLDNCIRNRHLSPWCSHPAKDTVSWALIYHRQNPFLVRENAHERIDPDLRYRRCACIGGIPRDVLLISPLSHSLIHTHTLFSLGSMFSLFLVCFVCIVCIVRVTTLLIGHTPVSCLHMLSSYWDVVFTVVFASSSSSFSSTIDFFFVWPIWHGKFYT